MIACGEKKEEYREIKKYWVQRLCDDTEFEEDGTWGGVYKKFTEIKLTNGYSKNSPSITVECVGIEIGKARSEWSGNWQGEVFVIKLGKIINH